MNLKDIVVKLRDLLIEKDEEPIVTAEAIYAEIIEQIQDVRVTRSCRKCKYHNPMLCAVNPTRTFDYFSSNDCQHWEPLNPPLINKF